MRDSALLGMYGKVFGLSWVWGITAIAYNTEKLNPAPDSVEVLWDPKNAKKVSVRDDAVEAVSYGAIATGQDMNHPADLAKVKEKLLGLKPQIATLWSSEDEWNKLFQAGTFDVSIYWSGSAARSKTNFKLPVGYMVPKEGGIGWFDGLAIAAGAPNVDGAHQFIDYMVDPKFYIEWATKVGAPASANPKANEQLPADDMGRVIHGDQAAIDRLQFMAPLSDEERQSYSDMWTEVKAEFSK
jgi:spermidine/putrescine transport system substrate-binding protein